MNQTLWIEAVCFVLICIFAGVVSVWLKRQTDEVLSMMRDKPPTEEE